MDDRPPEALLGHYVGIALFLLAVVWIPGTADQFVGPRMVILATLGIGILPLALIRWLRQPASRAARLAVGGLLALAVWAVISAVGSGSPWALSLFGWWGRDVGLLSIGGSCGLFLAAATLSGPQAALVLRWVLAGAAVTALVGVLQWFGVPLSQGLGGPVTLTMGNANFAAAYAGITASIAAGSALCSEVKALWRWAAALLAGALFALSVATESLQGPVAGAVGIWIAIGVSARLRNGEVMRWLFKVWAAVSAIVGAVVALSFIGIGPIAALWQENTYAIRVEYWRTAVNIMAGLPVFGSGPDGFARYLGEFRPESYVEILGPANNVSAAHNIALNWGATLGFVALGFWVLSIGAAVWLVIRSLMNRGRPASHLLAPIAGGLGSYLVQGMVSIDMIPLMSLGWVLVGLTASQASPRAAPAGSGGRATAEAPPGWVKPAVVVGSLLGLVALAASATQVVRVDAIRNLSAASGAIAYMTDPMIPCDARRDVTEQVLRQVPIAESVGATVDAARIDPRCPYMVNLEADATIKVREMDTASVAVEEGVAFDPLYDVAWVFLARRDLIVGDLEGAKAATAEAERVQALYPESQRDFGLIRNLYADIRTAGG